MDKVNALDLILYSPCAWINPQRLVIPALFNTPECLSLLNEMIIKHFRLSTDCQNIMAGSLAELMIKNWSLLPQVAWLLACRYHRDALLYQGGMADFSREIQLFCTLSESARQPVIIGRPITTEILEVTGMQFLLSLAPFLPEALVQRIPLLFCEADSLTQTSTGSVSINILDFQLTLQYAKNHYQT